MGAGAGTLVDDLLERGLGQVTLLDVSPRALEQVRARLGVRAEQVEWLVGDITSAELPRGRYQIWHDRAVFHFLIEPGERRQYLDNLRHALTPSGHVILSTFAEDGPRKCSGLATRRYSADELHRELGTDFELVRTIKVPHRTPSGGEQLFRYGLFCRVH